MLDEGTISTPRLLDPLTFAGGGGASSSDSPLGLGGGPCGTRPALSVVRGAVDPRFMARVFCSHVSSPIVSQPFSAESVDGMSGIKGGTL